jgi:hypothetical protein
MVEIRAKKELHRTSFVYGLVTIFIYFFILLEHNFKYFSSERCSIL